MIKGRGFFHPLLLIKKSRRIMLSFVALAITTGSILFWKVNQVMASAGIDPIYLEDSGPLMFLFSATFQYAVMIIIGIACAGWIASKVVGPSARLEEYVRVRGNAQEPIKLKVRQGDKMSRVANLVNEI